ncbi:hypothetical protein FKM82_004118 [Ascaphus truei]
MHNSADQVKYIKTFTFTKNWSMIHWPPSYHDRKCVFSDQEKDTTSTGLFSAASVILRAAVFCSLTI